MIDRRATSRPEPGPAQASRTPSRSTSATPDARRCCGLGRSRGCRTRPVAASACCSRTSSWSRTSARSDSWDDAAARPSTARTIVAAARALDADARRHAARSSSSCERRRAAGLASSPRGRPSRRASQRYEQLCRLSGTRRRRRARTDRGRCVGRRVHRWGELAGSASTRRARVRGHRGRRAA